MTAVMVRFVLNTKMSHGGCWFRLRPSGTLRSLTLRSFTLCDSLRLGFGGRLGGTVCFFGGPSDWK